MIYTDTNKRHMKRMMISVFLACLLIAGKGDFALATLPSSTLSSKPLPPSADVLIIHNSLPGHLPKGWIDGNTVLDLLGHFGLRGVLQPIEQYKSGDIERFRYIIVLGVDGRPMEFPPDLLSEIRTTRHPVFWINNHINDLLKDQPFSSLVGFRITASPVLTDYKTVSYKGEYLIKGDPSLFPIEILDPSKVQILATALHQPDQTDEKTAPYIIRSGTFWYCADSPFADADSGSGYLVFCDLLHDFFGIDRPEERKALVRIEDVSVDDDIKELKAIADYLHSRHIPFQLALIPIFKNPDAKVEIHLSDRPRFVRALHYMVSRGGTIVMHGVTHQLHGISADDCEFWDIHSNKPPFEDNQSVVERKLRTGMKECFANKLYPVTWETPHYKASDNTYLTISRYFNSSYEQVSSMNNADEGHYFPYPSMDRFNRFIIPEELGYIDVNDPQPEEIILNAKRMSVVRDGVASFFFHPFVDIKYLAQIVDGIQKLGYRFVSIRDYDLRIQMDDFLVQTSTGSITLSPRAPYLHRFYLRPDGRVTGGYYIKRKAHGVYQNPGIVPANAILVMEGVQTKHPVQKLDKLYLKP